MKAEELAKEIWTQIRIYNEAQLDDANVITQALLDKYNIIPKFPGMQYLKGPFVQLDGDGNVIQSGEL